MNESLIKKFNNKIYEESKIKEICNMKDEYYETQVYRAIYHNNSIDLKKTDFYPSFMERNNNKIPSFDSQSRKDVKYFSMSVYGSLSQLKDVVDSIKNLKQKTESYAVGVIDFKKGINSKMEYNGHIHYFIFDPIDNNPVEDFSYEGR